ncbi:MAG TPA: hypothetical protein VNW93_06830, partial [Mycobacterium sp.]|nr:hypothetical protein [Mycobacterium sp.]
MITGLGGEIVALEAPFDPETGAYHDPGRNRHLPRRRRGVRYCGRDPRSPILVQFETAGASFDHLDQCPGV